MSVPERVGVCVRQTLSECERTNVCVSAAEGRLNELFAYCLLQVILRRASLPEEFIQIETGQD